MTKSPPKKEREDKRKFAMNNLNDPILRSLSVAHLVEISGQYGEAGSSAVHDFKYLPALHSEYAQDFMVQSLMDSRQDRKRYTGSFSEYDLLQRASSVMDQSLGDITVQDIVKLLGSKKKVSEKYAKTYVSDLDEKEAQTLTGMYASAFLDSEVAEALALRAKAISGRLEEMVLKKE
ncbi:MAG TPA: hypothetical protein VJ438_02600, partial [Candidatus Nanoarchaeia archaeon]|nr:hypothetical protein [Candidatus Nanoarchaeia archaeon]